MEKKHEILRIFPASIRQIFQTLYLDYDKLQEIRFRAGLPLVLVYKNKEYFVNAKEGLSEVDNIPYIVSANEIKETLEYVSSYSLYAFEEEIKQGFITIQGGHRVGIAGKAIMEGGGIKGMKYISYLHIRFAHQVFGCANPVMSYVKQGREFFHTLIISPPMCGKTTLLRDMIRQISDGGMNVSVVDERSEIGASYHGMPQNDLGKRTDLLDCCPKAIGMMMVIRTMSPEVIAVDEIGNKEDVDALHYAMNCGCKMLATVHGTTLDDLKKRPYLSQLVKEQFFERYVFLSKEKTVGQVDLILDKDGNVLADLR